MNWPEYLACFFAGAFLANAVPHFVNGISGNRFPTPFAHPPGRGLSSPVVNTAWALLNLIIGAMLFRAGKAATGGIGAFAALFAGIAVLSLATSIRFASKHKE